MTILLYILLGFAPSIIWLLFYLRKDAHPESNSMVIKTFILGMLLAPLAIIGEVTFEGIINILPIFFLNSTEAKFILKSFLIQALNPGIVEESLKFLAVKFESLKSPEFDEPTDIIIYFIIVGLGFAAVENLFSVFTYYPVLEEALRHMIFRFLGATFLHAVATGMIGYWLARAILKGKNKFKITGFGLLIAIFFHTCYNALIVLNGFGNFALISVSAISLLLISGATILSYQFKKLNKQKSICNTN